MEQNKVRVYQFKDHQIKVTDFEDFNEESISANEMIWIEVNGFKRVNEVLKLKLFSDVHPLLKEDLQELNPRAKMQIFDFYCSIVLKLLSVKNLNIHVQQLNIIVSEKVILTVFESPYSGLEQLKMHIQDKPITQMDTLLYGILDAVVDDYNLVFDEWSTHVDKIEEELLDSNDKSHMKLLQSFKKQLFLVYRSISPLRDVLSRIAHNEIEFMSDVIALYHRDILDHLIQVLDEVDLYRETLNTMVEVYLSSVSNRTNDIMRVLTIISTVFIPLTFIVGLYGMNFDYMPELKQPYGYPIVIVVMIAITVGLIAYFKRKNWF